MAGGKLISTGVEFPDATTQTTSGLPLTGGTMTGALTTTGFTSTGIDDNASALALVIDSAKNVRIGGGTPESSGTLMDNFEFGVGGILAGYYTTYPNTYLGSNVKFNAGGGTYYKVTDQACLYTQDSAGIHTFQVAPSGTADSAISWTTAMTIDNSGNTEMKDFSTTGASNGFYFDNAVKTSRNTTGSVGHCYFYNPNGIVGSIKTSGSATSYNTSSDYRLKENVVPMTGSIDRLKDLKPSRFNFKADTDKTVDGFLAHEAGEVVPECATGTKDAMMDEEYEVTPAVMDGETVVTEAVMGTRSVPDYQGIDQSEIVPLLVASLQEAVAKIEALEARVTALEV